jgi:hypothetical protein
VKVSCPILWAFCIQSIIFSRLKSEYQGHLKMLGVTGAGIDPEMITEESPMANLISESF